MERLINLQINFFVYYINMLINNHFPETSTNTFTISRNGVVIKTAIFQVGVDKVELSGGSFQKNDELLVTCQTAGGSQGLKVYFVV